MGKRKLLENYTLTRVFIWMLISIGCFFILAQFSQDRGMWMDEAELVSNIINSSFLELFKPFENGQVAPILYLVIQKCLSKVFGDSDLIFRIFPLIATFLSSFFLYLILRDLGVRKLVSLLGVALFLTHPNIIYYSSEAKQYPIDIFATLTLILIGLKFLSLKGINKAIGFALLAVPLFFISNITIIIFIPIALVLIIYDIRLYNKVRASTIVFLLICSSTFMAYYFLFINNHSNKSLMLSYWIGRGLPGENVNLFIWSGKIVIKQLFLRLLSFENYYLLFFSSISFFFSFILLLKEKKVKILTLTLVPICIHLFLAIFYMYPFWRRLILYMIPLFIILLTAAIGILISLYNKKRMLIYSIKIFFCIYFVFNIFYNLRTFPLQYDKYKLAMTYLNETDYQDEPILIFAGKSGLSYYKDLSHPFKDKIETIGNTGAYSDLIVTLKKREMTSDYWLIFSYRIDEWKNQVLPILKEKGEIDFIKGTKTFLGKDNGYLYKFTPYKRKSQ